MSPDELSLWISLLSSALAWRPMCWPAVPPLGLEGGCRARWRWLVGSCAKRPQRAKEDLQNGGMDAGCCSSWMGAADGESYLEWRL